MQPLAPIERCPHAGPSLRRFAAEVERRTDTRAFIAPATGSLLWAYVRRDGFVQPVWSIPLAGKGSFPRRQGIAHCKHGPAHADEVVRTIMLGRVPARQKDRLLKNEEDARRHDAEQESLRDLDTRRGDALAYAKYRQEKRGMGRHWKKSLVVSGGKASSTSSKKER